MAPRLYCPLPLQSGIDIMLPADTARHVQVLRLQPGDPIELFHGGLFAADPVSTDNVSSVGASRVSKQALTPPDINVEISNEAGREPSEKTTGWFEATILHMGRKEVSAHIGNWHAPKHSERPPIHIACVVPTNERMDWLVEKAVELGAASIQPLLASRSVLRLSGERAQKRVAHWQFIAIAACEQSGRTFVPLLRPLLPLEVFLAQTPVELFMENGSINQRQRLPAGWLLSLREDSLTLPSIWRSMPRDQAIWVLSGPEGGLTEHEEIAAMNQGWQPVSLSAFTLRAETAPLSVLAALDVLRVDV